MTQQPYAPPAYPQQFPQPGAPQGYPQQFPQPPVSYAPPNQPGYAQPAYQPPAAAPAAPLATGSIDDYYNQPSGGGGPAISWKGAPDGATIAGIVARDVTNSDIQQDTGAPNTTEANQPKFYRDGRPMFHMQVPLRVQPSPTYPDGEAKLFVRGQMRDELVRAMGEAGQTGAPQGGSAISVTLVQRKQGRGAIPQNIFHIVYTPPGQSTGEVPASSYTPPAPPQAASQWAQPPAAPQQQAPVGGPAFPQGQPSYGQPVGPGATSPAPGPQAGPAAPQYPQAPQQPQGQQYAQAPQGMSPEQAELFARITGGQPQGQPQGQA